MKWWCALCGCFVHNLNVMYINWMWSGCYDFGCFVDKFGFFMCDMWRWCTFGSDISLGIDSFFLSGKFFILDWFEFYKTVTFWIFQNRYFLNFTKPLFKNLNKIPKTYKVEHNFSTCFPDQPLIIYGDIKNNFLKSICHGMSSTLIFFSHP